MWAWPWCNCVAWTWGQPLQMSRRCSWKNVLQIEDVRRNFCWYLYMYIYSDMLISRRDMSYQWTHILLCVFWYLARICRNEQLVFLLQWTYKLLRNNENSEIINICLFEWEFLSNASCMVKSKCLVALWFRLVWIWSDTRYGTDS